MFVGAVLNIMVSLLRVCVCVCLCIRRVLGVTVESDVVSVQLGDGNPLAPQLVDEPVKQCMKELVRSSSTEVERVREGLETVDE